MQSTLQELEERFTYTDGPDEMRALLHEAEQLLLQEIQEWLMLMKFAKVEPA